MVVYTISEIIKLIIILLFILTFVIFVIYAITKSWFDRHFRQNCYKCKYWKLFDVAGSGGICWYKCQKNCLKEQIRQDFNDDEYYTKCKQFEEGDK